MRFDLPAAFVSDTLMPMTTPTNPNQNSMIILMTTSWLLLG
jgi:hypothetical protein